MNGIDRQLGEHVARLRPADRGEAARLVLSRGQLGQRFVIGEPDRDGDADLALDRPRQPRQQQRRRPVVKSVFRREIEIGLVQRHRLHERRRLQEQRANGAARRLVFRHVGRDHHRMRAQLQRLPHRHRRTRPKFPRDIARRHHHPAPAGMADDHRLIQKRGIVALFHRGIERVAIDMRDVERRQFRMRHHPRRAATRAGGKRPIAEMGAIETQRPAHGNGIGARTRRRKNRRGQLPVLTAV